MNLEFAQYTSLTERKKRFYLTLLASLLLLIGIYLFNDTGFDSDKKSPVKKEILPGNVKPTRYDLTLEPDFSTFDFYGSLNITFDVLDKKSKFISLNALDIKFNEVVLYANGHSYTPKKTSSAGSTTTFEFSTSLKYDIVYLYLNYTGILNDNMSGFYKSTYEQDGETKYLATTQMEPTDARRAFPSYDQPDAKAVFDISLISDKKLTCLSNMDVKETIEVSDDKKKVVFNSTPVMSTYLVAFVVGELEYVETNDYRVPIRVYTTPGLKEQGVYLMNLALKVLAFYDSKFDFKFPLPKMDMIGIHDFTAGAMENFGLVTYRVVDLLLDESTSTASHKERVSEVVAHELAHQWFGDLVTMEWWEGLWLNEGFATWMSWFFINHEYPEWKVWEQYVSTTLHQAMSLDSMRSSHPIEVPVGKTSEINQIFDSISYAKGSSVLKMIANWIGEDVFIKGVSRYLHEHAWTNTKTSDLWELLSQESGEDIVGVMDIWTKKAGYPVLTVVEDGNKLKITQNRFLSSGDANPADDKVLYPVFLSLRTKEGVDGSLVLYDRSTVVDLEDIEFYKLNADQAGIYRTLYPDSRWTKLAEDGSKGLLSVEDRAGLIGDASSLARSGYASTLNLLSILNAWKHEESFTLWSEISNLVEALRMTWMFEDDKAKQRLENFAASLIDWKLNDLGYEFKSDDSYLDQRLKTLLFSDAISSGIKVVHKDCRKMFDEYVAGNQSAIDPNLRVLVYEAVAKDGKIADYEAIVNIYKTSKSSDQKVEALYALGAFEDTKLLDKTFALLLDGTVRAQDIYIPLRTMSTHKVGAELSFKWLKENWDLITKILPPGLSMLGSVATSAVTSFTKPEQKIEVEKFFKSVDTEAFDRSLSQALESIQSKIDWLARDGDLVNQWLIDNGF